MFSAEDCEKMTVLCHFYNEEYLLPWWLDHHRKIFNHGIMIDYRSTDSSREIIKHYCPDWEIHETRNRYFDSEIIDTEVVDYEHTLTGWRMALNVTEFLVGNTAPLKQIRAPTQHLIGNYVFVHPVANFSPDPNKPLYDQVKFGYYEDDDDAIHKLHLGIRAPRSIHNHDINYPVAGRHWHGLATTRDLAIFYYGYAFINENIITRKLQIKNNMSPEEFQKRGDDHPNTVTRKKFVSNIDRYHLPRCRNISSDIETFTRFHRSSDRASVPA